MLNDFNQSLCVLRKYLWICIETVKMVTESMKYVYIYIYEKQNLWNIHQSIHLTFIQGRVAGGSSLSRKPRHPSPRPPPPAPLEGMQGILWNSFFEFIVRRKSDMWERKALKSAGRHRCEHVSMWEAVFVFWKPSRQIRLRRRSMPCWKQLNSWFITTWFVICAWFTYLDVCLAPHQEQLDLV